MWWQAEIRIATRGRGFYALTDQVTAKVRESGLQTGLCHLFLRHTSAGLCVTENADPEVRRDLERFAQRLAPDGDPLFQHDVEGPDDMPAHVRNLVLGYQVTVPIHTGRPVSARGRESTYGNTAGTRCTASYSSRSAVNDHGCKAQPTPARQGVLAQGQPGAHCRPWLQAPDATSKQALSARGSRHPYGRSCGR